METTPQTLNEAISYVINFIKKEKEEQLFSKTEDSFVGQLHHGLGRWMRNNWGFWKKEGNLYNEFIILGIEHPDDMSGIILCSSWRTYNEQDTKLEEQIQYYKNYWQNNQLY